MSFKEVIKLAAIAVTVSMASVVVGTYIHLSVFEHPTFSLAAEFFQEIILLSLVCGVLCLIFYSRRELGAAQIRVRMAIHFTVSVAAVLLLVLYWRWILPQPSHILLVVVLVALAYATVLATIFYTNKRTADLLNDIIRRRKSKDSAKK